jgi:cellulose synthase/poly-beta-1,6-N-acetylglucosamine synthase-like glycosyltransferase
MISQILFWTALGLIAYAYAGFPILLLVRGAILHRRVRAAPVTPSVSLIIVGHNEVEVITEKLDNVFSLAYPPNRLEVILASDGSDDGTNEAARGFVARGLRLLERPRSGKIPALNAAVAEASGEILVFSDANSIYDRNALRALVAPFADPLVGGVGGNQVYRNDGAGQSTSLGERLYWRYDRMLKSLQSRSGSMTSATGAMHALRRELFQPVPPGVSDDFLISTRAIASGHRLVFAPDAIARESVAATDRAEFNRKLRVMTRAIHGVWVARKLLNPFRFGFYSLQLLSHKLLRWSVCWLLVILLLTSLALYDSGSVYRWIVWSQATFYAMAALAGAIRWAGVVQGRYFRIVAIPLYFCMANYAAMLAWFRVFSGARVEVWDSRGGAPNTGPAAAGSNPTREPLVAPAISALVQTHSDSPSGG